MGLVPLRMKWGGQKVQEYPHQFLSQLFYQLSSYLLYPVIIERFQICSLILSYIKL